MRISEVHMVLVSTRGFVRMSLRPTLLQQSFFNISGSENSISTFQSRVDLLFTPKRSEYCGSVISLRVVGQMSSDAAKKYVNRPWNKCLRKSFQAGLLRWCPIADRRSEKYRFHGVVSARNSGNFVTPTHGRARVEPDEHGAGKVMGFSIVYFDRFSPH